MRTCARSFTVTEAAVQRSTRSTVSTGFFDVSVRTPAVAGTASTGILDSSTTLVAAVARSRISPKMAVVVVYNSGRG